jgi:hypothetical protein
MTLGFALRALWVQGSHSITWAMPLALFALVILDIGFLPRPAWTAWSYFTLCTVTVMTGAWCYAHLFSTEMRWGLANFFLFGGTGIWTQVIMLARLVLSTRPFFVLGLFKIGSGWPQIMILLISASWIAKITGMSHWCPARKLCFPRLACNLNLPK